MPHDLFAAPIARLARPLNGSDKPRFGIPNCALSPRVSRRARTCFDFHHKASLPGTRRHCTLDGTNHLSCSPSLPGGGLGCGGPVRLRGYTNAQPADRDNFYNLQRAGEESLSAGPSPLPRPPRLPLPPSSCRSSEADSRCHSGDRTQNYRAGEGRGRSLAQCFTAVGL